MESLESVARGLRLLFAQRGQEEGPSLTDPALLQAITALLTSYDALNNKDWSRFTHFDPSSYTRILLDSGANNAYNLMLICWSEGQGSPIHDHPTTNCVMKILAGSLRESRFAWPQPQEEGDARQMILLEEKDLKVNSVSFMHDSLGLHRMENTSHVLPAVSLHLYCPPFHSCRVFDQRTSHVRIARASFSKSYSSWNEGL